MGRGGYFQCTQRGQPADPGLLRCGFPLCAGGFHKQTSITIFINAIFIKKKRQEQMLKKNTCSCLCYYGILLAEDEKIKTGRF